MNEKPATPTDLQTLLGEDHAPRWWRRPSLWIGLAALLTAAVGLYYWQAQQAAKAASAAAPASAAK